MKRLKSYWVNALKYSWNWLAEKVQHHPWRMLSMLLIISLLLGIVGNILPWHINQHWESLITIQAGSGTFVFALMIFIANRPSDRPEQPYVLLYTSGIIALVILVLLGFMISLLGLTVDSTLLYYFASWLLVMTIAWIAYAVYQLLECLLNESLYYDLLGKALCYDLENNRSIRTKIDQLANSSIKSIRDNNEGRSQQLLDIYYCCFSHLFNKKNQDKGISLLTNSFTIVCNNISPSRQKKLIYDTVSTILKILPLYNKGALENSSDFWLIQNSFVPLYEVAIKRDTGDHLALSIAQNISHTYTYPPMNPIHLRFLEQSRASQNYPQNPINIPTKEELPAVHFYYFDTQTKLIKLAFDNQQDKGFYRLIASIKNNEFYKYENQLNILLPRILLLTLLMLFQERLNNNVNPNRNDPTFIKELFNKVIWQWILFVNNHRPNKQESTSTETPENYTIVFEEVFNLSQDMSNKILSPEHTAVYYQLLRNLGVDTSSVLNTIKQCTIYLFLYLWSNFRRKAFPLKSRSMEELPDKLDDSVFKQYLPLKDTAEKMLNDEIIKADGMKELLQELIEKFNGLQSH